MKLWLKSTVKVVAEVGVQLLFLVGGGGGGGWSEKTKLILYSTLVKV